MDAHFEEMLRRLKLTTKQKEDALTKYQSVARTLYNEYYESDYNGGTKLLIGSYGKKTNIRPPTDIDLLFKLPAEVFDQYYNHNGNGSSALLQDIKAKLSKKYTTTEKISAWGKVVLVQFSKGKHNVELLPGYEVDGVFMIPNAENGGSWESFDARADLRAVADASASTNRKARKLIKIIKRWRIQTTSLSIKSFGIEQFCLLYLEDHNITSMTWSEVISSFFTWLNSVATDDLTQIQTALSRAKKAVEYEAQDKPMKACDEWRKVFGSRTFPAYNKDLVSINALEANDASAHEQYIEDIHPVRIDPQHQTYITAKVTGRGFRDHSLQAFVSKYVNLPKHLDIVFQANNVPSDSNVLWKVRNFGAAARADDGLRGQIHTGVGLTRKESSKYLGTHYVECYVIQNEVCVAKAMQFVPIGTK